MDLNNVDVELLAGIGAQKGKDLAALGVYTILDLLYYFPHRYVDHSLSDLNIIEDASQITVQGVLLNLPSIRWFGKSRSRLSAQITAQNRTLNLVWFNQAYLKERLKINQVIMISGRYDKNKRSITVERTLLSEKDQEHFVGSLEPIYSASGNLKSYMLRKYIQAAWDHYGEHLEEVLPAHIINKYKLISRNQAVFYMHFARNHNELHQARRRLIYEELFIYQFRLANLKQYNESILRGRIHKFDQSKVEEFIKGLPFELTGGQLRVINEILIDLRDCKAMNRLLQGDVGSGKTVVAAIGLYANFLSGFQGALMVPTEILAEQHAKALEQLFSDYNVRLSLLTGSMSTKIRREILEQLASGEIDIIIGTHALIQEKVNFNNLGFVITDEQHRFGVKQRAFLREKGEIPDVLMMTATPIPRTLAISVFGELDVSIIDELPSNRKPISTYWVRKDKWDQTLNYIERESKLGCQVYVVCPLIEESEKLDLQNAHDLYSELVSRFPSLKIGLLHGRLSSKEKDEVMQLFGENQLNVLVATTVIEVGINVPNATLMIIYDADRFGLSQLHQLRGRVGRGVNESTCILVANPKSQDGIERMKAMVETTDGFIISKRDLQLRGPGDFLGVKQSGLPMFNLADLERDSHILECANSDVLEITSEPTWKEKEEYQMLLNELESSKKHAQLVD